MINLINKAEFGFILDDDRNFIVAFDEAIKKLGYESGGEISQGFCWGRYMIIYSKSGIKDKKVAVRIYIREDEIILRLYFNGIDKHKVYIENAPDYILESFIGSNGNCGHCHNDKDGKCKFRKSYTLFGKIIDKCNGVVFEYHKPDLEKLTGYIDILKEFYIQK